MNYQHWTMRDAESRRGVIVTISVASACLVVIVAFTLFVAGRGSTPDLSAAPADLPAAAPATTDETTASSETATGETAPDISIPRVELDIGNTEGLSPDGLGTDGLATDGLGTDGLTVSPDAANGTSGGTGAGTGTSPGTGAPPDTAVPPLVEQPSPTDEAHAELDALSTSLGAINVAGPARKFAGTYALANIAGTAHLMEWNDGTWDELRTVPAPAAVQEARATDVTGDGSPDFVVWLDDGSGGVLNATGVTWDWMRFVGPDGATTFVGGLDESNGRLTSMPAGATGALDWRWDGFDFVPR